MKVLAVGAPPDDIEILAAGTLFKYKEKRAEISICVLTDGSAGHREIPAMRLKKIRKNEAQNAAKFLGSDFFWLGIKDEMLFDDEPTRLKLIEIIRRAKPDVMFCHSESDYHQDHQAASKLCFASSFIASITNVKTKSPALEKVPYLYQMDTLSGIGFQPEEYVDISSQLDRKLKMLDKHGSQVKWLRDHDNIDIQEMVATQARFRGLQASVEYAESFRLVRRWGRVPTERLLP
jgi:LmbE family N-acetylglucosaminyl deacetylase